MSKVTVTIPWEIDEKKVKLVVTGTVIPYWPGVMYYPDGSGAPPEGGFLEDIEIVREDGKPLSEDDAILLANDEGFESFVWDTVEEMINDYQADEG